MRPILLLALSVRERCASKFPLEETQSLSEHINRCDDEEKNKQPLQPDRGNPRYQDGAKLRSYNAGKNQWERDKSMERIQERSR